MAASADEGPLLRTAFAIFALVGCAVDTPAPASPAATAGVPTSVPAVAGAEIRLQLVVDGLSQPTAMAELPDGRMLVTEQGGRVRVIRNGVLEADPLLDLSDRVLNSGERGLLGIVLHPEVADNGRYFVMYSDVQTTDTELREFNLEGGSASEGTLLLEIRKDSVFHHGGSMLFGRDGHLYVSIGDDGRQGNERADPNSLYGTVLRLDVDSTPGAYAIPADNPFVNGGGAPEVWLYGLRNPWRMSMDSETGDLFIGDVGQNTAEEINVQRGGTPAGLDFGWSATEGAACRDEACDTAGVTWPSISYGHDNGDCGVIGGYVARGNQPLSGRYLFGDLCSGRIWSVDAAQPEPEPRVEIESGLRFSSFGLGADGTMYVLVHYSNGSLYRIAG